MIWFILLAILLALSILFFIIFAIFLENITPGKYDAQIAKLVNKIAKKNNLVCSLNLNLVNYDKEPINVNHILFGKKYIYLISDFKLNGFVSGDANDKSWIYFDRKEKKNKYIANLNELAEQNIEEISSLLQVNKDPFVSISIISLNCDFRIKNKNRKESQFIHFLRLSHKIKHLEKSKIDSLDEEQILEEYKRIEEASKQSNM